MAAVRWLGRNRVALALGLVAALPVIVSVVREVGDFVPVGDRAMIALRAYDVLSAHPPLVGHYSAASQVLAEESYGLGPMLYALLAVPSRLGSSALMLLTVGLVNVASVMGSVALALRRGGVLFGALVSFAFVVMLSSLAAPIYSDIWNPSAGLLPLTLLMFLAWSLACGEYRLLPLAVLAASFVMQCHLAFVPPAVGSMAVGLAGLWFARPRTGLRRWVVAACVVGVVCWAAPVVEQITERPGNFVALARTAAAGEPTLGLEIGWKALVRTVGVPPWWTLVPDSASERLSDLAQPAGVVRSLTAALVLAALVAVIVLGRRRGRRDVVAAGALGLVLCLAIGFVAASTPSSGLLGLSIGYTLWWGSPGGIFVWLVLAWSAAVLWPRRLGRPLLAGAAALAVAVAVVWMVRAGAGENLQRPTYSPMRTIVSRLEAAVPPGTSVLVESTHRTSNFNTEFDFEMGSAYVLRRHGADVLSRNWKGIGSSYDLDGHRPDQVLRVSVDPGPVARPGRLIARLPVGSQFVTVTLAPAR
jgi:hypothetical protein